MRTRSLLFSLVFLPFLPGGAQAQVHYDRPINVITSNYDLVDTTYIDRGLLDGVKVGDKFQVKFPDGKLVATVIVTGVYERMSSVKIQDSWLLKDGQLANYHQRPMITPLESNARRSASALAARKARKNERMNLTASKTSDNPGALTPTGSALPAASDINADAASDPGLPTSQAGAKSGPPSASLNANATVPGLPTANASVSASGSGLPPAADPNSNPGLPPPKADAASAALPSASDNGPAGQNIPPPPE